MHKYKTIIIGLLVITLGTASLGAQEPDGENEEGFVPKYSLGDQSLGVNLGMLIPLFFTGGPGGVEGANLSLGGAGSLAWSSYLTNNTKLGIELGGTFALTANRRTLFMVPIALTGSYVFRPYPWEFPISMGVGINISALEDARKTDPFVKIGGSAMWNFSTQWAFGANLHWWLIPQIYLDRSPAGSEESRLGNFLALTFSAVYNF
ncbi:MAG: TP0733 family outer membrane beta-barrel protein [Spirochaetales bacterium]